MGDNNVHRGRQEKIAHSQIAPCSDVDRYFLWPSPMVCILWTTACPELRADTAKRYLYSVCLCSVEYTTHKTLSTKRYALFTVILRNQYLHLIRFFVHSFFVDALQCCRASDFALLFKLLQMRCTHAIRPRTNEAKTQTYRTHLRRKFSKENLI